MLMVCYKNSMDSRLYKSAKSGNISFPKQLLNENPSLLLKLTPHENTALHIAVWFGHKNIVIDIYSRRPSLLVQPNLDGETPLHVAARAGLVSIFDFLLTKMLSSYLGDIERGISGEMEILRLGNKWNNTVLHEAVKNCHLRVVELLLKVDPELPCFTNDAGESPLYLAAREGMVEIVNQILTSTPSSAHGGSGGRTALHVAVIEGHFDIVESLLKVKPQIIKEVDDHGKTPLHYTASIGDHRTTRKLLELDTSLAYMLDKDGLSPLHVAANEGHTNIIKEIIQYCPDSGELLDLIGQNALHTAVMSGKVNVVRYVLEIVELEGLQNQADNDGNTPFHLATIEQKTSIIHYFMWDGRVDRRAMNNSGQTAIDIDHSVKETKFLKILLSSIWRKLHSPRTWIVSEKIHPSAKQEEATVDTMQTYKQMGHTLLMVAALITTVTFTAAFTMPGGYNNDIGPNQGVALLLSSNRLNWFIISDTIAMTTSITAACIIFWGMINSKDSYVYYFASATVLTYIALQSTAIAFSTGVAAVLPDKPFVITMTYIIGTVFHVSTFLFLLQMGRIFSICEVYHFMISSLCKHTSKFINRSRGNV